MSLSDLINRPCTINSRTASVEIDESGDETYTSTTVETVCEIQQRRRDEPDAQGEFSDTDWLGIFPAGTALDTSDTVSVDDATFEVVGDPWPARNPRTRTVSHVEASLRKAGS